MSEHIWFINGAESESLSLNDRGLAYGDGLFETMRVIGSEIPLRKFHLARHLHACQKLNIDIDEDLLSDQINKVLSLAKTAQSVIKVIVTRAGAASGYGYGTNICEKEAKSNIYIRLSALESSTVALKEYQPELEAKLCDFRLSLQPALAGIKHLNRLEQVMAAAEIRDPSKEGILMDTEGHIIEAISNNLIIVIDGVLHFPDLGSSGVKGVMQTYIAELCEDQGISFKISKVTYEALCGVSEILVCNSIRGVRNISNIAASQNNANENLWKSQNTEFGSRLRKLLEQGLDTGFYSF